MNKNRKFFLVVAVVASVFLSNPSKADKLDPSGIILADDGKPRSFSYYEAFGEDESGKKISKDVCEIFGKRFPTARDASISAKTQSSIEIFFGKLVGKWNFQSSQDIGFNADGTIWRNWEMYKHFKKVELSKGQWSFDSSFCTRSPGQDMCSESLFVFKMVGKKLTVTIPENSTDEFPVEVLSSSPSGITIRFSLGITSITQTHRLSSDGLWSEVIQVYSGDKLTAVQTITSKRVAQ